VLMVTGEVVIGSVLTIGAAILGTVKLMLHGKVNKSECDLMHTQLQLDISEIKVDIKAINESTTKMAVTLATLKERNIKARKTDGTSV